jgi:uncharacterized protein YbaR (Trm112 family)
MAVIDFPDKEQDDLIDVMPCPVCDNVFWYVLEDGGLQCAFCTERIDIEELE